MNRSGPVEIEGGTGSPVTDIAPGESAYTFHTARFDGLYVRVNILQALLPSSGERKRARACADETLARATRLRSSRLWYPFAAMVWFKRTTHDENMTKKKGLRSESATQPAQKGK